MRRWLIGAAMLVAACGSTTDPNATPVTGTWQLRSRIDGVDSVRIDIVVAQGQAVTHWNASTGFGVDFDAVTAEQGTLVWTDRHESDAYALRGDTLRLTSARWTGVSETAIFVRAH